jgi:hypothetical protein
MQTFNEFLAEQTSDVIQVDNRNIEQNMDSINAELDALTEKPYQNAPIFLAQLRGVTERYGFPLPQSATDHFLDLGAELMYILGTSPYNLYVVYDTNEDGFVDGYAQIVSDDELEDLLGMDSEELLGDREEIEMRPSTWYAKRDDDSGDDSEY